MTVPGPGAHTLFRRVGYGVRAEVRLEGADTGLDEMLSAFGGFLRACGCQFDGAVEIAPPGGDER